MFLFLEHLTEVWFSSVCFSSSGRAVASGLHRLHPVRRTSRQTRRSCFSGPSSPPPPPPLLPPPPLHTTTPPPPPPQPFWLKSCCRHGLRSRSRGNHPQDLAIQFVQARYLSFAATMSTRFLVGLCLLLGAVSGKSEHVCVLRYDAVSMGIGNSELGVR